jgi:hypothetical protein
MDVYQLLIFQLIAHVLADFIFQSPKAAESKNDIAFNDRTFKFKPTGPNTGVHELAIALSTVNNQITYPTITIIDRNYSILFHKQSYIKTKDLISILGKIN